MYRQFNNNANKIKQFVNCIEMKQKINKGGHGYNCAMFNCLNISGRLSGLSFFRFPKDAERCKLWLRNCGRTIPVPMENLYKNYRICGNHFDSSMFLNDLKNRLQSHAVPKSMDLQKETDSIHVTALILDNHVSSLCNDQDAKIINEDNQKNKEVQTEQLSVTYDKKIQTDCKLSKNSPRKIILKKKINLLHKKITEN